MKYNELFGGAVVKDGYRMLALVANGGYFDAIIYRERTKDYVFCSSYDIHDGTWGQGHYCATYAGAVKCLCEHLM